MKEILVELRTFIWSIPIQYTQYIPKVVLYVYYLPNREFL